MANQIIFKNHLKTYLTPLEVSIIRLQILPIYRSILDKIQSLFLRCSQGVRNFCGCFLYVIFLAILIYGIIQKKIFFSFFQNSQGGPYDFGHNCKGPPYEFSKNEKKKFSQIIPYIKMAIKITYKTHLQKFLNSWEHLKKSLQNRAKNPSIFALI